MAQLVPFTEAPTNPKSRRRDVEIFGIGDFDGMVRGVSEPVQSVSAERSERTTYGTKNLSWDRCDSSRSGSGTLLARRPKAEICVDCEHLVNMGRGGSVAIASISRLQRSLPFDETEDSGPSTGRTLFVRTSPPSKTRCSPPSRSQRVMQLTFPA